LFSVEDVAETHCDEARGTHDHTSNDGPSPFTNSSTITSKDSDNFSAEQCKYYMNL